MALFCRARAMSAIGGKPDPLFENLVSMYKERRGDDQPKCGCGLTVYVGKRLEMLSLWMISTGVFLGAPTPFQAAWDVLEVVEHDQERLTCQRPRSDPGPDLIHRSALAKHHPDPTA